MPTEGYENGKLYFTTIDDVGYKELKFSDLEENLEEDEELESIKRTYEPEGELEVEITNENVLRKIRRMLKTDKEKKEEIRQNRENFRKFIKGRR